jgi:uncharacterized membrane protein
VSVNQEIDGHSKERVAALTDGIYSVAMTLLVIDLKVPESLKLWNSHELAQALIVLEPTFTTWATSFFVLALFYMGNVRSMRALRTLDTKLVIVYVMQLALVSLMPFSTALVSEYRPVLLAQIIYSLNLASLAVLSLIGSRHITRHPSLLHAPIGPDRVHAGHVRSISVLVCSVVAVLSAMVWPGSGQVAFLLMLLVKPIGRAWGRTGND